jgi:uncharacterized membrane protein (UPF0182 family)
VITDDGRLVWMVDGYTTSLSHPYSATLPVAGLDDGANYIRNAVKATVDAYTGKFRFTFSIRAIPSSRRTSILFPKLFLPASEMPADSAARALSGSPFQAQAEAYRTFHMRDPQVFYNKEDIWDIAHNLFGQSSNLSPCSPPTLWLRCPEKNNPSFC